MLPRALKTVQTPAKLPRSLSLSLSLSLCCPSARLLVSALSLPRHTVAPPPHRLPFVQNSHACHVRRISTRYHTCLPHLYSLCYALSLPACRSLSCVVLPVTHLQPTSTERASVPFKCPSAACLRLLGLVFPPCLSVVACLSHPTYPSGLYCLPTWVGGSLCSPMHT